MKKLLAILTVMCMVLTTLVVPTVAFGTENENEDNTVNPEIVVFSDEACENPTQQIHVNKSKGANETSFYVKYPKGETLQYKVGSRHMLTIGANEEGEGGDDYTVWRMEGPNSSEVSYYDYDTFQHNKQNSSMTGETLINEFNARFASIDSVLSYIKVEDVIVDENLESNNNEESSEESEEYSLVKVSLKNSGTNEFRGSEDFLFIFSLAGVENSVRTLELNFGVEFEYDATAINEIDTESTGFYRVCKIDTDSEVVESKEENGVKTVLLSYLGSFSTGRSDLRHGVGSEFWVQLNDGYQITGIYDTINDTDLPYTAKLISYFKVYNGSDEVKIELLDEDVRWGGMSAIGSGEPGEEDRIIASAYTTHQELAMGGDSNVWSSGDPSWDEEMVGYEDTSEFYAWCKENGYTSELMGTHLIYTIYMPIDKQCKIKITTSKATNIESFEHEDEGSNTNVKYSGSIDDFQSSEVNLGTDEKEAVNKKLEDYYNDDIELIDVYEFDGTINGSANIAIPVDNANNYEIVWLAEKPIVDEDGEPVIDDNGNVRIEMTPVPMLSVETATNDAKIVPIGHFSKYAVVGKQTASNDSEQGGNPGTTPGNTGDNTTQGGSAATTPDNSPNTGDDFSAVPYIVVTMIALAGVAVAMFRRKTVK